jgi:hypothetical protein
MARLQILELPTEHHGDDMVTPFVLVIDKVQNPESMLDFLRDPPHLRDELGARTILVFDEEVEIPANEPIAQADPAPRIVDFADLTEAKQLTAARDEARQWARHGYEIGQRHCGWSDHGVAPDWLTEGWPPHFDSCEHLKRAADYDEALTRVRSLSEEPKFMDALHSDSAGYRHGYRVAIGDAKRATRNERTQTGEDGA